MKPAMVRSIQPERDENLVAALKDWLAQAERGEIIGAVLLGNMRGDSIAHRWAGLMPLTVALLAFEYFKRSALDENK